MTRDGNHRDKHKVGGLMATTITIPEAMPAMTPMVMNPVISDSTGFMAVPWAIGVQAESVKDAYAIYYDTKDGPDRVMNDDDLTESHTVNLGFNSSGMFYIDATRPHYGVKVVVSYVDADGYMRTNNQSEPKYIPFVHSPHDFSATPANDGKGSVNLKWKIDYPDEEDFIETGDMWLIQRSITGRDEDFVDLTSIMFDRKSESYEYKDSTVLEALTADDINGTNLPIVLNSSLWA